MYYFTWDRSFDTGIDVIDEQHRCILECINELHAAMSRNDDGAISTTLDKVIYYTLTHFAFEEKMMEGAGYQHAEAHRKVHKSFAARIKDYTASAKAGADVSKKLLSDLTIWLTNHIKNEDRHFANQTKAKADSDNKSWVSRAFGW